MRTSRINEFDRLIKQFNAPGQKAKIYVLIPKKVTYETLLTQSKQNILFNSQLFSIRVLSSF